MDVVYIVGTGSKWNNMELRYSLRSICTYAKNLGVVYVCTEHQIPWLIDKANSLKQVVYKQPYSDPAKNVLSAIRYFFNNYQPDEFLLANDDFFYVNPVDLNNYPMYSKGQLPSTYKHGVYGDARYSHLLCETYKLLSSRGLPTTNFAHHCLTHWDRWCFDWAQREGIWDEALQGPYGVSNVSVMCNIILFASAISNGISPNLDSEAYLEWILKFVKPRTDIKLSGSNAKSFLEGPDISSAECFSIYDTAIRAGVADYLAKKFPQPCRYEL